MSFLERRGSDHGPKYRVKLQFGIAYLSPSAILFAIPLNEQPYVRRDGVMVRDDTFLDRGSSGTSTLNAQYKLLFGTDNVYSFLRLYTLVCSLLTSTRQHQECLDDPPTLYSNQVRKSSEAESQPSPVDYGTVLSALKEVLAKKMDARDYETLGRRLTKTHTHEYAVLPKLIERCADALVSTAKEDCLLQLYDYCKYSQADPVVVRTRCYAVASEAMYRIQYDTKAGAIYFNHLPKGVDLLTTRLHDDDAIEEFDDQDADDAMEEDEDPIQEFGDSDDRPNKRLRAE